MSEEAVSIEGADTPADTPVLPLSTDMLTDLLPESVRLVARPGAELACDTCDRKFDTVCIFHCFVLAHILLQPLA